MMDKRIRTKVIEKMFNLIFVLLMFDFFVLDKITNLNFRIHDIVFVLYIFIIISNKKVKYNPSIVLVTFIYFMYSIVVSSIYIILGNGLSHITYLYIMKEIIYITSFFIILKSYSINTNFSKRVVILFVIMNILFGVYSLFFGGIGHYGIGTIASNAPSQSGIIYFTCMLISVIYRFNTKKRIYLVFIIISAILTISTISRTSIIGLVVFIFTFSIFDILESIKKKTKVIKCLKNSILIIVLFSLVLSSIKFGITNVESTYLYKIRERFSKIDRAINVRILEYKQYFDPIIGDSFFKILFGQGKGIPEIALNRRTLAVDNQYARFIIEIGLIGTSLWIMMIFTWVSYLTKNMKKFNARILYSFVFSFLVMGLGYENFQATKSGISFWIILGIVYTVDNNVKNKKGCNYENCNDK